MQPPVTRPDGVVRRRVRASAVPAPRAAAQHRAEQRDDAGRPARRRSAAPATSGASTSAKTRLMSTVWVLNMTNSTSTTVTKSSSASARVRPIVRPVLPALRLGRRAPSAPGAGGGRRPRAGAAGRPAGRGRAALGSRHARVWARSRPGGVAAVRRGSGVVRSARRRRGLRSSRRGAVSAPERRLVAPSSIRHRLPRPGDGHRPEPAPRAAHGTVRRLSPPARGRPRGGGGPSCARDCFIRAS